MKANKCLKKKMMIDWVEELDLPISTITWRRRRGWSDEEILFGRS
jgi:hypothetical protein